MGRNSAVLFMFCLFLAIILVTGCTQPVSSSGGSEKTGTADRTVTVSPTATPDIAKPLEPTTTELPKLSVPAGSVAKYYVYTLDGTQGVIGLALPTSVYDTLEAQGKPNMAESGNSDVTYFQNFMNEPAQQKYVQELADEIKKKSSNPDDQVRIAVSLVQHIPYHHGDVYRYPYEVLYEGTGICGEKSMLLALLLKDLGYGSCTFYFRTEGHMAAGIRAAAPYDYKGSGYAFIETTEPKIITYNQSHFPEFGYLKSDPLVVPEGTGKEYTGVSEDYRDAQDWARIQSEIQGKDLSAADRALERTLEAKYDLGYFTCQNCSLPPIS